MSNNNKTPLVPKLRFPQFLEAEDWKQVSLGSVAHLRNGYAFKSSEYVADGPYQIITIANVQQGNLTIESTKRIAELPSDIQQHQILNLDDILISMTGNVGRVCRVTAEGLLLNQRVGKLIPEKITDEFFFQVLQREDFRNSMQLKAAGGAQGNLSTAGITDYTFNLPSVPAEQQKIADCLSSLDELIAAQARKVDALKTHKKGLMQQLFPREGETQPRLRFPEFRDAGDWERATIGDLKPFVTSGSRGWAPFYAERGELFVRITNLWRDSIYLDLTDSKFVQLPSGANEGVRTQLKEHDVLISITADIGIIGYVDESVPSPAYINQHIALVRFEATHLSGKYWTAPGEIDKPALFLDCPR